MISCAVSDTSQQFIASVGTFFRGVMAPVLWVLAVLSTITVIHRIQYTYQNTKHLAPIKQ